MRMGSVKAYDIFQNVKGRCIRIIRTCTGYIITCIWNILCYETRSYCSIFGTAIAIIIIIDGILKLQYAIEFYHMEAQRWWIEAIVAALMVVMGVVALFNPFGSSTVLMMFVGIVLMVEA